MRRKWIALITVLFAMAIVGTVGAHPGDQHGEGDGHLIGGGAWGDIELVSTFRVGDAEEGLIADLAVYGNYAYLARWGGSQCAGPERRGQLVPDGGAYVIDISNIDAPRQVAFIPTQQDTLVGEGLQALRVTTPSFNGDILAMNHEPCGKNSKGGFSLWNVTNPAKPVKLVEHAGDATGNPSAGIRKANSYHSIFVWDAGSKAYLVGTDNIESSTSDVDIFDITDPRKPVLITELLPNLSGVSQPALGLTSSFLHDMVVKEIGGKFILLLSYWDGGYVLYDVTNPHGPVFLGDSDYDAVDPELFAATGVALTPEGNGHQAEFTANNKFVIATDEDFDPFRAAVSSTDGTFNALFGTNTTPDTYPGGDTVFVGRACPGDAPVPAGDGVGDIAVVERGVCLFTEKLSAIIAAGGYSAVVIMNREGADACNGVLTPSVEGDIPTVLIGRDAGYGLFDVPYDFNACLSGNGTAQAPIAIGTRGDDISSIGPIFDGWGYVQLFAVGADTSSLTPVDTFAIPEAMDESKAFGYGDLSVHEVATDLSDPSRAYLAYYSGGLRSMAIVCTNPGDSSTCSLEEVGGYLDEEGNNFWGVETQIRDGETYVFGSDRDSGLWVFRRTP